MIVIGLLFFLIGLGILANGIFLVFKVRRQLGNAAKTVGTVVAFGRETGKSGYIYCPQVSFLIPSGERFGFQSKVGSQPPSYTAGQQVRVVYQKTNPRQAEINSPMALWFVPACFLIMSLVFTALGLMLFGMGILFALNS